MCFEDDNISCRLLCDTQHEFASWQEDHRPDDVDASSPGSGRCASVLRLFHLNELLVSMLTTLYTHMLAAQLSGLYVSLWLAGFP